MRWYDIVIDKQYVENDIQTVYTHEISVNNSVIKVNDKEQHLVLIDTYLHKGLLVKDLEFSEPSCYHVHQCCCFYNDATLLFEDKTDIETLLRILVVSRIYVIAYATGFVTVGENVCLKVILDYAVSWKKDTTGNNDCIVFERTNLLDITTYKGVLSKMLNNLLFDVPNETDLDAMSIWFSDVKDWAHQNNYKNIENDAENGLFFCNDTKRVIEFRRKLLAQLTTLYKKQENTIIMLPYKYDVFLSHAHADKESFVADLKKSFDKLGIKIFYDTDSIKWGNNWKKKIYEGLDTCRFAVIVISDDFYGREWTEEELKTLLTRQNSNGEEVILPILYNTSLSDMQNHYKSLADIQFLEVSDACDIKDITILLAERLLDDYAKTVRNV